MAGRSTPPRQGWSVQELVLGSCAVLLIAAVAWPWLLELRETSRASQCRSNLAQLAAGLQAYHDRHGTLPPAAIWSTKSSHSLALHQSRNVAGITHQNWARMILPDLGEDQLARQFVPELPIGAEENRAARTTAVKVMSCPSDGWNRPDNLYDLAQLTGDDSPLLFARGNYAINGGTHNYQTEPPSTAASRGDLVHLVMRGDPRTFQLWGNGIAGINKAFSIEQFRNGQGTLVALEELRAGIHPVDPRGVWSLGQIGGSITWGHGVGSDAFRPNHQWSRADDILGCGRLHEILSTETILAEQMPCVHYVDANQQATSRSRHPGGVHVAMIDQSVRFISDQVDPGLWHVMHSRETPADRLASGLDEWLAMSDFPEKPPQKQATSSQAESVPFENSIGMILQPIAAGEFVMGVPDLGNNFGEIPGCPPHRVRITRPFHLSRHEVTREQFQQILGHPPAAVSTLDANAEETERDFPVVHVTWDEAVEFCRRLSSQEPGRQYRLPTEAEWEYCCRSGTSDPYDWSANRSRSPRERPEGDAAGLAPALPLTPVGQYEPNDFGLYDMRGNAWEWTADWFDRDYYARSPVQDPQGPAFGFLKVVRGGEWRFVGEPCHIDYPMLPPWKSNPYVGFRVVCELTE